MGITRVTCPSNRNVEERFIDTAVIRDSIQVSNGDNKGNMSKL